VIEVVPGIRAFEVASPFEVSRHDLHGPAAAPSAHPLTVTTSAGPWSYVASFPAADLPPPRVIEGQVGWMTRVACELVDGDAAFSYIAADYAALAGEASINRGEPYVDVFTDDLRRWRAVMMRVGGSSHGTTSVRIDSFRCFAIADDETDAWRMPSTARLALTRDWNHFYGTPRDLAGRVRHMRFQRLDAPRVMQWLLGLDISLTPGDQISQAIYTSGLYEPCTMTVLSHILREGDVFVDVGANIGAFTLVASRLVGNSGRVISLEPSSRENARLRHNIALNRLQNVTVHDVAAGAETASGMLHVAAGAHTGLNTLEPSFMYSGIAEDHVEQVAIVRLDDVLQREGLGNVRAIKVDAEGGEHRVIAGARRTIEAERPVLILEVAGPSLSPDHEGRRQIEAFLNGLQYRLAAIDAHAARLVPVPDLAREAENFVAAPAAILDPLVSVVSSL
jgi:FkbM family methyltransferase